MGRVMRMLKSAVMGAAKGAVFGAAAGAGGKGLSNGARVGLEAGVEAGMKVQIKEIESTITRLINFFANNPQLPSDSEEIKAFLLVTGTPRLATEWFVLHLGADKLADIDGWKDTFGRKLLNQLSKFSPHQISRVKYGFERWPSMSHAERLSIIKAARQFEKSAPYIQIEAQPGNVHVRIRKPHL